MNWDVDVGMANMGVDACSACVWGFVDGNVTCPFTSSAPSLLGQDDNDGGKVGEHLGDVGWGVVCCRVCAIPLYKGIPIIDWEPGSSRLSGALCCLSLMLLQVYLDVRPFDYRRNLTLVSFSFSSLWTLF
jgi:hypothetical protein